jgi:hypothetical protein
MTLRLLVLFFLSALLSACHSSTYLVNKVSRQPDKPLLPVPKKIVLVNVYDIEKNSYRKSKELQFKLLIDGALRYISLAFQQRAAVETVLEKKIEPTSDWNSALKMYMQQHEADYAIVIDSFDVHFLQTHVEVTQNSNGGQGKSREAFYDIIGTIGYTMVLPNGTNEFQGITTRQFHSSRAVISGLLAAGPNIVKNHDDAVAIVEQNAESYVRLFLPSFDAYSRKLFSGGPFKAIREAIAINNFTLAKSICEPLTENVNPLVVAKAYYNLAVLAEHEGDHRSALRYLGLSLENGLIREAMEMRSSLE